MLDGAGGGREPGRRRSAESVSPGDAVAPECRNPALSVTASLSGGTPVA